MELHPIANLFTLPDTDLSTTPLAANHVLQYDGNKWVNQASIKLIDGSNIGIASDTDLLALTSNLLTVAGKVFATDGGDAAAPGFAAEGSDCGLYCDLAANDIFGLTVDGVRVLEYNTAGSWTMEFGSSDMIFAQNSITTTDNILSFTGQAVTLKTLNITAPTTGAYKLLDTTGFLALQSQASGQNFIHRWFTKDGDGTDALLWNLVWKGSPTDLTNSEIMAFGFIPSDGYAHIQTFKLGTGTLRPLRLFTGTNTSQLILNIDGSVSTGGGRIVKTDRLTSNTTLDATHHELFCDTDGGAFTVTLPAGVDGTKYRIINAGSSGNDLTITPDGAELLTGVNASRTLSDSSVIILTFETTENWW